MRKIEHNHRFWFWFRLVLFVAAGLGFMLWLKRVLPDFMVLG